MRSGTDADRSTAYATEVARLLWPEPWGPPYLARSQRRTTEPTRDAYVFPGRRRPRLLVPADVPGAAVMLGRLGTGHSPLLHLVRSLASRAVATPAFARVGWPVLRVPAGPPGADSIESHLARCLGTDVRVGVLLGTRRVNQKPVLQVFDLAGDLLAYAKVGHNDLTAALVRREAAALQQVGGYAARSFTPPRLLHHGRWADLEVLVVSALRTDPRRAVSPAARVSAMTEVARMSGAPRLPLLRSRFWSRLVDAATSLRDEPDGVRLSAAADRIVAAHGPDLVSFGAWHGDWGRWNMGPGTGAPDEPDAARVLLWDWERFDPEVPLGFDGLHFDAQRVRPGEPDAHRLEADFLGSVPATLAELGVPAAEHDLTLRLYLLEIATRYVEALGHGATPALRRRTAWVLSLLEQLLGQPRPAPSGGRP